MYLFSLLAILVLSGTAHSDNSLSFLLLGDWGGDPHYPYTTAAEVSCAKQMGSKAEMLSANFTVALGDNMYYKGVQNEYDSRFNTTFENVFTAKSLQHKWYILAGNHDHAGNVTGQLAYTSHSPRWYFPAPYYSKEFTIPGSCATVQIIFIDTIILSGLSDPTDPTLPYEFVYEDQESLAMSQWQWIEDQLKASEADWLLVAGHYPVWSIAEHGPTQSLVTTLRPLLEKYKVTAYICGHDHNMQHLREDNSNVEYFVVGAGHYVDSSNAHKHKVPDNSLKYFYGKENSYSDGAFASITVSSEKFEITYTNVKGQSIYQYSKSDPRSL